MKLLPLLMVFMYLLLANPAGAQVQKQRPYLKPVKIDNKWRGRDRSDQLMIINWFRKKALDRSSKNDELSAPENRPDELIKETEKESVIIYGRP